MRKSGSDPQRTREKILARATAEFAARGYSGARVDAIARRCGLAKNMLYHYFGSKEGLFIAVLERTYETLRARQRDFAVRGSDPVEAMRQLGAHTFSSLAYHYLSNQYTLNAAFGIDFTAAARRKAWLAHITDMILSYCQSEAGAA